MSLEMDWPAKFGWKRVLAEDYLREPADLLLANLHYAVVKELVDHPSFYQKRWGILSGLLRSEARHIRNQLDRPDFSLVQEWDTDCTWFTILGRNRGPHG